MVDFITLGNTGVENSNPKSQFLTALQDPLLFGIYKKSDACASGGSKMLTLAGGSIFQIIASQILQLYPKRCYFVPISIFNFCIGVSWSFGHPHNKLNHYSIKKRVFFIV